MESCENTVKNEEVELESRDYQAELLETADQKNTILFLPTGSGKTYIAVMLIKKKLSEIEKSYDEGGKRTFFMVNTVPLVEQQAEYIRRFVPAKVGSYSGFMKVDYWNKEIWTAELRENQILVMTCQIFLDMLNHNYVGLENCNLLIFDECHHAVENHPMRQIMQCFEGHKKKEKLPRLLGLTATLLNTNIKLDQVKESLSTLEKTFHSTVATVSDFSKVSKYSTNPLEHVETYDPDSQFMRHSRVVEVLNIIDDVIETIHKYHFKLSDENVCYGAAKTVCNTLADHRMDTSEKSWKRQLKNCFQDLRVQIEDLGVYGGYEAALVHIIQMKRWMRRAEDDLTRKAIMALIDTLKLIRSNLYAVMERHSPLDRIKSYSSSKALTLFRMLRYFKLQIDNVEKENDKLSYEDLFKSGKIKKKPCALIFVKRRTTSKTLYKVLKALARDDPEYKFLLPDFIVGYNVNAYKLTREAEFHNRLNSQVIKRFNSNETNLLVTTDVLEEGVDISQCTFVMKFDEPANYRSYVQSRGRARSKNSLYILMTAADNNIKFLNQIGTYGRIEAALIEELVGRSHMRQEPDENDIAAALYDSEIPPYRIGKPGSPQVTLAGAISVLNRYCMHLPHDKFTKLTCLWWLDKEERKAFLQLPINSPVRQIIEGPTMSNKKQAKRAVALKACEMLHKCGELDDHLLPRVASIQHEESYAALFPCWENENKTSGLPGTKNNTRPYVRKCPVLLSECRPTPDAEVYVHGIRIKPAYQCPPETDNRMFQFYNILQEERSYAILSSKPLPKLCEFSIYMNVGKLEINIIPNCSKLRLTSSQISSVREFHVTLFSRVIEVVRPFMVYDVDNDVNSFFIVPTREDTEDIIIDWNVMEQLKTFPDLLNLSDEDTRVKTFRKEDFDKHIVIPWYRENDIRQVYVVTRVCDELTPQSAFPNGAFSSFREYFRIRYALGIDNPDQPLLEVQGISHNINCLRVRGRNTRKLNSIEILIPELVMTFTFPPVLWIKATCLPSILHRLSGLLSAEEVRQRIVRDAGIGAERLPEGFEWSPCHADSEIGSLSASNSECDVEELVQRLQETVYKFEVASGFSSKEVLLSDDSELPVDIDRTEHEPTDSEIEYYDRYVCESIKETDYIDLRSAISSTDSLSEYFSGYKHKSIDILKRVPDEIGPQLCDILKAITASTSHDMFNLERYETLGDSFLKFAVSLFLFDRYPLMDEGKLTVIKGKLVGNRNLFYCGRQKGLGEVVEVREFAPKNSWVPPSITIQRDTLMEILLEANCSSSLLRNIAVSEEEQMSGMLQDETVDAVIDEIFSGNSHEPCLNDNLLWRRMVSDKSIADSVEALTGVYLESCGIIGAISVLNWFKVIPTTQSAAHQLFKKPVATAMLNPNGDVDMHLLGYKKLEAVLGYTFNDRSFLLQALSHPTYTVNRITDCYQRLEFLGDAILDFLVTCFIYENCGKLSPGQLTDLRSALVNNVTFASLSVRYGFHKYLLYDSIKLMEAMNRFVCFQEKNNHNICEEVLILMEEREIRLAEAIEVPKIFGDLFESIAAAIYLDSGKSLAAVWKVYYRLMRVEIEKFSKKIPKQSVRLVYEISPGTPVFQKASVIEENHKVMVPLDIMFNEKKKTFYGVGVNKKGAKLAASKLAVRYILKRSEMLSDACSA